jgi:polyferredoxin
VLAAITLSGWVLGLLCWLILVQPFLGFLLAYIGTFAGTGIGLYIAAPKPKRNIVRRLVILELGVLLFGLALARGWQRIDIQLEGAWFALAVGVVQATVIHYLLAKIIGPVLFGRVWCGWACWTAMVLDQLPFKRSPGRVKVLGWGRLGHFGLSLALVLALVFGFGYQLINSPSSAIVWFVAGNVLYYSLGIGLAFVFKDNRAFCKYACPISVPLKLSSRLAMVRIQGDASKCNRHQECEAVCPMDIDITEYLQRNERIRSSECILCLNCVNVCPENALSISFQFDPWLGSSAQELMLEVKHDLHA